MLNCAEIRDGRGREKSYRDRNASNWVRLVVVSTVLSGFFGGGLPCAEDSARYSIGATHSPVGQSINSIHGDVFIH